MTEGEKSDMLAEAFKVIATAFRKELQKAAQGDEEAAEIAELLKQSTLGAARAGLEASRSEKPT